MPDTIEETMRQQGATVYEGGQEKEGQEEPKKEETVQSTQDKQEEVKDEHKQQPEPQEKQEQPSGEPETKQEEQKTWLEQFNERFKTQYDSEDKVGELLDYKSKHDNLQETVRQKEEALNQASDPSSYFANESLMKVNEIVKQHNVDPATAAQLTSLDFSQMNDEQVVLMDTLLESPEYRGDEDLLKMKIQRQYGLNINLDDYEDDERSQKERELQLGKREMQVAARKAREKFQKMQQVELPKKQNLEEGVKQRDEQIQQSAEKNADKFISDISKIDYGEGMEYEVDSEWKSENMSKERIKEFALKNRFDLSDEQSYEQAKEVYKMAYVYNNLPKILKNYKDKLSTQKKDEEYDKYNNPRPNNGTQAPPEESKPKSRDKVNDDIAADMGIKK